MPLDARTYLFDILRSIENIRVFVGTQSFEAYEQNALLVSAVERQLMIVGEAVTQLLKLEPNASIAGASQIIGFRNILVHNYARVSQAVVWAIIVDHLPKLEADARAMLGEK